MSRLDSQFIANGQCRLHPHAGRHDAGAALGEAIVNQNII
ncbi:hypothetical protein GJA_4275 [Janthinobacterium agaricidamnosum NBRC 102515 = DSM 9628]|uniref:Uncharacterized protein n=1 Tax=Janthinobacterium agaricidamnosum NBRC 102515 = DSM 9628 TaxID=1349767 RepID=W0VC04_9BURK|nr:hypothetical protein GJA_4275 [Janthinobacterium agaricidamnosum NBRC 102515 = DSM 9628]